MVTALDTGAGPGRALLGAVALLRGVELAVSARNARRLRARGAEEHGRGHYPAMVALHAGLLAGCALEPWLLPAPWPPGIALPAAALVLLAAALRWWAIATLGERWTTRVLVLPGAAPVRGGPYRWLRHPNYLAVAVEVAALPLACGAWRTALAATLGDALVLAARIRAEERALGAGWREAFRGVPRLVPGGRASEARPTARPESTKQARPPARPDHAPPARPDQAKEAPPPARPDQAKEAPPPARPERRPCEAGPESKDEAGSRP